MTPLQQEPSAHAPWMRTMFGRAFISGVPSWSCLVAILRREAAAGVSAALLHFADACCAAGVAVPRYQVPGSRTCAPAGPGERAKETYRRVSLPVLSCAVAGGLPGAITSRSWWRPATPSLG